MSGRLVLLRHGQSEWNAKNLFTGFRDVALSPLGIREAQAAGLAMQKAGLVFAAGFTSVLRRAQDTGRLALKAMDHPTLHLEPFAELNERDYGSLTGLNKDAAREKFGAEQVHAWRRGYATRPPDGESLKDTVGRVIPLYVTHILPCLLRGQTTLIAAHGNSLRALVKVLERLEPEPLMQLEIPTGVPIVYDLAPDSSVRSKEILPRADGL